MTLNDPELPKIGVIVNFFAISSCDMHFRNELRRNDRRQTETTYNLHMKFSALNVNFSSPRVYPVGSRRRAHAGVKEGYPSKKWLFIGCWLVWRANDCR